MSNELGARADRGRPPAPSVRRFITGRATICLWRAIDCRHRPARRFVGRRTVFPARWRREIRR